MNQVIKGDRMIFSVDVISIAIICIAITLIAFFGLIIRWLDYLAEESNKEDLKKKGERNG